MDSPETRPLDRGSTASDAHLWMIYMGVADRVRGHPRHHFQSWAPPNGTSGFYSVSQWPRSVQTCTSRWRRLLWVVWGDAAPSSEIRSIQGQSIRGGFRANFPCRSRRAMQISGPKHAAIVGDFLVWEPHTHTTFLKALTRVSPSLSRARTGKKPNGQTWLWPAASLSGFEHFTRIGPVSSY
jgi:hypothetical protein